MIASRFWNKTSPREAGAPAERVLAPEGGAGATVAIGDGAGPVRLPSAVPPRLPRFSERELLEETVDLVDARRTHAAVKNLIDALPALHESKVNIKEKLSALIFLSKIIQNGGGAKYGAAKLRSKIKALGSFVRKYPLPAGGFIELGCGAHDPIGLSMYFYLNGFEPACGIDLLPPRVERFSAMSMYDILSNMKMFPERYCWPGSEPADIERRIGAIDVEKFENGDFWGGLAGLDGRVNLLTEDLLDCDLEPGSIALFTSFAVLEHVTDLAGIFERCYDLLAPGGIAYHFIDLADHRSYRGDGGFGPLAFLYEDVAPANMNRLRAPSFIAAALAAGFEVLVDRRIAETLPEADHARMVEPFRSMAIEDVAIIKQQIVLRKPA